MWRHNKWDCIALHIWGWGLFIFCYLKSDCSAWEVGWPQNKAIPCKPQTVNYELKLRNSLGYFQVHSPLLCVDDNILVHCLLLLLQMTAHQLYRKWLCLNMFIWTRSKVMHRITWGGTVVLSVFTGLYLREDNFSKSSNCQQLHQLLLGKIIQLDFNKTSSSEIWLANRSKDWRSMIEEGWQRKDNSTLTWHHLKQ